MSKEREVVLRKLERIAKGEPARVLDLFAGCGGLSLGFHSEGFQIIGAVENDPFAAKSHAANFFKGKCKAIQDLHAQPRDIVETDPEELIRELCLQEDKNICLAVDVVIAGPPCQAFARVGRAKLREVYQHPKAHLHDPRANLYLRFLHYVKALRPIAVLMENVPDAINYGGHNIPEEMCEVLSDLGYDCRYTLLNAVYYGVPQMRERMFLIAYATDLGVDIRFPKPTHWIELPKGYEGSRAVALKNVNPGLLNSFYTKPPQPSPTLRPAVTAREAIEDLPPITLHLEGKLKRGARRFVEKVTYRSDVEPSVYAILMRSWPGFESPGWVADHVIRYLPRDYEIFRRMKPGDQYPQAYKIALEIFEEKLEELARTRNGRRPKPGTLEYECLKKAIVPPYDPRKFPNRWRKMEADKPARTLMAHLGKDSYTHIHYDSAQARTISVREAARLQSFPDGFVFAGTMNPAFRQIGNAVPPLLAKAIAGEIRKAIQEALK